MIKQQLFLGFHACFPAQCISTVPKISQPEVQAVFSKMQGS